jgi:hypothetical protein
VEERMRRVIEGLDGFRHNIFTGKYPGKIPTEP